MANALIKTHRWRPGAMLAVQGPDALTFLQGQFTNDLRKIPAEGPAYGLWLDHKGHVVADSFVLSGAEQGWFWICSYFSSAEVIRGHLEAHLVADDVTVTDVTAGWHGVTIVEGSQPSSIGSGALVFAGRRGIPGAMEVLAERPLDLGNAAELDDAAMERLRIEAGMPRIPVDIGPGELPNEAGLDNDAISHTKGCYTGQEVVARLRSTGRVRRRLTRVGGTGETPESLTKLFQGDRPAGEIRSSAKTDGGFVALALLGLHRLDPSAGLSLAAGGPAAVAIRDRW